MPRMGSSGATLLAVAILASASLAAGQQFKYASISIPGSTETFVYGVNDFGTVVGYYTADGGTVEHAFMKAAGKVTNLDFPGAEDTFSYAVNNSGEIAGQYLDVDGSLHAFQYDNGAYTNIDPPGAKEAAASAINNVGQIAGSYTDDVGGVHGFILQSGSYQTLDVPGADYTNWAGGINDVGQVTLQWTGADSSTQSSVYNGSKYTQIRINGAQDVSAYGINKKGNVAVVWLEQSTGLYQAALRIQRGSGYAYPLIEDPLQTETDSTAAYGVNNNGVVVGSYIGSTGDLGFVASPVR